MHHIIEVLLILSGIYNIIMTIYYTNMLALSKKIEFELDCELKGIYELYDRNVTSQPRPR